MWEDGHVARMVVLRNEYGISIRNLKEERALETFAYKSV